MAFRWRADDGPKLNAGLVALWFFSGSGPVLLRNPTFLWFFRGVSDPLSPPLDPHMACMIKGWLHIMENLMNWLAFCHICSIQAGCDTGLQIFSLIICRAVHQWTINIWVHFPVVVSTAVIAASVKLFCVKIWVYLHFPSNPLIMPPPW